jgi:hypothetical protein
MDFRSFVEDAPTAKWVRCGITVVILLAVAVIFIAPSIDLPDGVLREHSALAHVGGTHVLESVAVLMTSDSLHAHHLPSEMRASTDRQPSGRGHDHRRPHVMRC